ncbi:MAG: glycosyltransferase [Bacteroidetes bacterium]|nr:glycosyltransferase [Bacteroidota bacterium]
MSRKARVLMVMASPFKSGLAPENSIRAKAVYSNPGFDVDIMCFPIGEDIPAENVHIIRVPKRQVFKSFQVGDYIKILVFTFLMMGRLLFKKDKQYDVIFLFNASYLFFWMIKPFYKARVVATIYAPLAGEMTKWNISGNKLYYRMLQKYEKFILGKYDMLIFNIEKMLHLYLDAGYDSKQCKLILHASEKAGGVAAAKTENSNFNILYAGSFVQVQNIELLYSIAEKLKSNSSIRFTLIGATEEEYTAETNKVKSLGLTSIDIFKRIDQQLLTEYYRNADILISCRIMGDDLPFKIIEYMSWGKCILATDRPIHNLVLNKDISCLVEPDAQLMADEILNLYNNPAIRKQYEDNISKFFDDFHSFDKMRDQYSSLIEEFQLID